MSNIVEAILLPTGTNVQPESVLIEDYRSIQNIIGGHFDCVRTNMGRDDVALVGYVHDEGLLLNMEYNYLATALFQREIRGEVVVVWGLSENGYYDGDNHDMPDFISDFLKTDLLVQTATAYNMASMMTLVSNEIIKAGYEDADLYIIAIDELDKLATVRGSEEAVAYARVIQKGLRWAQKNLEDESLRDFCEVMLDTVFDIEEN